MTVQLRRLVAVLGCVVLLMLAASVLTQAPGPDETNPPRFEVATVKRNAAAARNFNGPPVELPSREVRAINVPALLLILRRQT